MSWHVERSIMFLLTCAYSWQALRGSFLSVCLSLSLSLSLGLDRYSVTVATCIAYYIIRILNKGRWAHFNVKLHFYFFLRHAKKKRDFLIRSVYKWVTCVLTQFFQHEPARKFYFLFFYPPTRQKYACRDPLTVKYTECGLMFYFVHRMWHPIY